MLSIVAVVVLIAAGIAQAAGVASPWPLLGLLAGGVLGVLSERQMQAQRSNAGRRPRDRG